MGRPKRNSWRRADRGPTGAVRRAKLSHRVGAIVPWILVGNTVWRIKRRPVWTCWRKKIPPCLSLKPRRGA